jgi:hypothetical protein
MKDERRRRIKAEKALSAPAASAKEGESAALRIGWWNDMRQRGVSQDVAIQKINAALAQPGRGGD